MPVSETVGLVVHQPIWANLDFGDGRNEIENFWFNFRQMWEVAQALEYFEKGKHPQSGSRRLCLLTAKAQFISGWMENVFQLIFR
jgi:hypothetical protein